ncbi:Retrovirus-related Pol polyprotein from transposon TNT 1-94 [Cucumis melo var. makuwa]|uniref:Retrovirus-related Pol polyprotein from transposon TNT 1-94 n=1 Tax=Cucumis melo var. makuwa TaxID=1194695 RepID=A0A5A7UJE6_CUCMM|nr:Retrovirus-related Pol polyprotein from transposon TNT 1-94 [Cucumis melo var. makuwa]
MTTRGKIDIFKPKAWISKTSLDWTVTEPRRVADALRTPQWKSTMNKELAALLNNRTWDLVPPNRHRNFVGNKWVFYIKQAVNGSIQRYKACLVLYFNNSFINGALVEEIYTSKPPRFVDPQYPDYVCKLRKAIYGLKQAFRAWNNTLKRTLLNWGFCQVQGGYLSVYSQAPQLNSSSSCVS